MATKQGKTAGTTGAELAARETEERQLAPAERFANTVIASVYGQSATEATPYQRKLLVTAFAGIDKSLRTAEEERVRKNESNRDHRYDNNLPCVWKNVNMVDLAIDLADYTAMGLDMAQDNMLHAVPYINRKKGVYDVTLVCGYNGLRYIAERYAIHPPKNVVVEVVHETDNFIPLKKDSENPVEGYRFEVTSPFNRGRIIGGFAYIEYYQPENNELIILSMADIEKRKPRYASATFWGGTTREYRDGRMTTVETDGWLEEMVRKTLIREAYSAKHMPRDPAKIDEAYLHMRERSGDYAAEATARQWQEDEREPMDFADTDTDNGGAPADTYVYTAPEETEEAAAPAPAAPESVQDAAENTETSETVDIAEEVTAE